MQPKRGVVRVALTRSAISALSRAKGTIVLEAFAQCSPANGEGTLYKRGQATLARPAKPRS